MSCVFQAVTWLVWMPNWLASWAVVRSPVAAARATWALKAASKPHCLPLIVMLRKGCLPPSEFHLISAPKNRGPPQQATLATAKRTRGTILRTRLQHRWGETNMAARTRERREAKLDDGRTAHNLSTIMRMIFGIGCPRSLQELRALLQTAWIHFEWLLSALDHLVAVLVAPMAPWSWVIGG